MIIKLTERFFADDESIQTVQFYGKGDAWCSPTLIKAKETFKESVFDATFKRRTPVRLVGIQADEAWANWKAYADKQKHSSGVRMAIPPAEV